MVYKIQTFVEWAANSRGQDCGQETGDCVPATGRRECVLCYERYVNRCLFGSAEKTEESRV